MKVKATFRLLAALSICLFAFQSARSAEKALPDTVRGIVVNLQNEPLPGAKIEITGQPGIFYTDIDGRFIIPCQPGRKEMRVSYPKMKDVLTKLQARMRVVMGKNWRHVPEKFQMFIGVNAGLSKLSTEGFHSRIHNGFCNESSHDNFDNFSGPNFGVMIGGVKAAGWYAKYALFMKPHDISVSNVVIGAMARLGCPLHIYVGGGISHAHLLINRYPRKPNNYDDVFDKYNFKAVSPSIDAGLMFRLRSIAFNLSSTYSWNDDYKYNSIVSLGFNYFFE